MENEDNKDHKKSNDNNWTKDFSALTNPPESYESDVAALVNSVLEILSNIVEQTAKAQQDVEHIKIQHNEANDDINFLQESEVPESGYNKFFPESNNTNVPPESKNTSVVEKLSNIAEQTAQAQQDMERIKNLMEKDDKDDGFRDMPEPGAPGPGRPLPDFPTPNPDPQPDPNNDSKSGSIWDQDNSEK